MKSGFSGINRAAGPFHRAAIFLSAIQWSTDATPNQS